MYAVVRHYTGASALTDALAERRDEVEALISGVPGFQRYHAIRSEDALITVTVCDDRVGTDESVKRAAEWVKQNMGDASISAPVITEGEVFIDF
jgi:heme-degrading monooxygenase HmoA